MRVMSYNTLFAGFDGSDDRRYQSQFDVVAEVAPDVLLLQEARNYLSDGCRLLFTIERRLGMRGFVAEAPATGQHTAVFIRPELTPISFDADKVHFHHAAASLKVSVPGFDLPVTVVSVHLCPNSPPARLREVSYLFNLADPASLTLVAGDFNSVSPDDPEPDGLDALPARFRMRYTGDDGRADRGTIASLLRAGFVDIGKQIEASPTATVPAAGFPDTEFVPFRSDYILTTPLLARKATAYGVVRSAAADLASDHYPVWADFQDGP